MTRARAQRDFDSGLDLLQSLAAAESRLQQTASLSDSGESEERDNVHLAQRAEEELAVRSSSSSSSGHRHAKVREDEAQPADAAVLAVQTAAPVSMGTSSSSSGAKEWSLSRTINALTASTDSTEISVLKTELVAMAKQHKFDMDVVEERLTESLAREAKQVSDAGDAARRIAVLESLGIENTSANLSLEEEVAAAELKNVGANKELNEANDKIAGLIARHARKILNLRDEHLTAELKQGGKSRKKMDEVLGKQVELQALNSALKAELAKAATRGKNADDVRDKMNLLIQTLKADHKAQMDTLRSMLAHYREDGAPGGGKKLDCPARQSEVKDLFEELAVSQEKHREASDALSQLRMEMLSMERGQAPRPEAQKEAASETSSIAKEAASGADAPPDVRAPTVLQGGARPSSAKAAGRGQGGRTANARGLAPMASRGARLAVIKEVDSDDGQSQHSDSCASSRGGSNLADGDVGDLMDFEDAGAAEPARSAEAQKREMQELQRTIEELESELAAGRQANDLLKEEAADDTARGKNSLARSQRLLQASRDGEELALDEMRAVKRSMLEEDAAQKARAEALQAKLGRLEQGAAENLKQDASLASVRTQLALALEGRRLAEGRIHDLKAALTAMERSYELEVARLKKQLLCGSAKAVDSVAASGEVEELRRQLQKRREQHNVLLNDVECKEVQWGSLVDEIRRDQAAEVAGLKQQHQQDVQNLESKLTTEIAELQAQVSGVKEVCWQTVCTFPDAMAFRCDLDGCTIRESTHVAAAACGQAAREGASLLTLADGAWEASGLTAAVHKGLGSCASSPGRQTGEVFQLGPGEFHFEAAESFSACVVAAQFPPVPRRGAVAELVVILHPHKPA